MYMDNPPVLNIANFSGIITATYVTEGKIFQLGRIDPYIHEEMRIAACVYKNGVLSYFSW